jgi:phosphoenolpyruvate---glycerone phosphotransferase subunit DhaL
MAHANMPHIRLVVLTMASTAIEAEQRYSELDAAVGDGDFGYSLARGFEVISASVDEFDTDDAGAFLKQVGLQITMKVGGTSGPLWGTAFLRASAIAGDKEELSNADTIEMLRAAVAGIQQRGQAELGDKTLLDALVPAIDELEAAFAAGLSAQDALTRAAAVARESAEATRPMEARRGRAAYSGERSIGTIDAGAVAVAEMFERVESAWRSGV